MIAFDGARIAQGDFTLEADWTLPKHSFAAVIGPSGAGKSTLLNAIAGFTDIGAGTLRIAGRDVTALGPAERGVSMIFQDSNLFPHLSIAQNVGLGLRPSLKLSPKEVARVEATLTTLGIAGIGARKPSELSGGQQSRVALARALLQDNPLLLLDEPFAALGPALKAEMLELVARLAEAQELTVLMVSHDPDDARRIADQTILVADGVAAAPRATADLFADPPDALRAYLGK